MEGFITALGSQWHSDCFCCKVSTCEREGERQREREGGREGEREREGERGEREGERGK